MTSQDELDIETHEGGDTVFAVKGKHLFGVLAALLSIITVLSGTWLGSYVDDRIPSARVTMAQSHVSRSWTIRRVD